jgi:hypothetical protein
MSFFNWDEDNIAHVERHDVTPQEIEEVFNDEPEYALNLHRARRNDSSDHSLGYESKGKKKL